MAAGAQYLVSVILTLPIYVLKYDKHTQKNIFYKETGEKMRRRSIKKSLITVKFNYTKTPKILTFMIKIVTIML